MTIFIKKGASKENIKASLKQLKKKNTRPKLSDFYGKLKGEFGDGLIYQQAIRNEWDSLSC